MLKGFDGARRSTTGPRAHWSWPSTSTPRAIADREMRDDCRAEVDGEARIGPLLEAPRRFTRRGAADGLGHAGRRPARLGARRQFDALESEAVSRPGLEARRGARLESTAQRRPVFVHRAQELVWHRGAQRDAMPAGHLHEPLRLCGSTDARGALTDRRRHQLFGSRVAQSLDVVRKDLHVIALSKAAGATGRAVVFVAQGQCIAEKREAISFQAAASG